MLRFLQRVGGGLALAGAFALIVVDGARWIAGGSLQLTPLADLLAAAAPGRVEALGAWLDVSSHPLASRLVQIALATPAFLDLAALAAALLIAAGSAQDEPEAPRFAGRA